MAAERPANAGWPPLGQAIPALPTPLVNRDHIVDSLDLMFASDIDVAVIEGPEGHGKTITAALFAKRHPERAFTLFLQSGSRWAYDPVMACTELGHQIAKALGKELAADEPLSPQAYSSLILPLSSRLKRGDGPVYFIVDGLYEIPPSDIQSARQIWDLLPFDLLGCKFLITRITGSKLEFTYPKRTKEVFLTRFSLEESMQYLADIKMTQLETEQISRTCRGRPDWLTCVRRLVRSGKTARSILEGDVDPRLSTLFDIEWDIVKSLDRQSLFALAILAHDGRHHGTADLARLAGKDESELGETLKSISFVEISQGGDAVSFVSEPYRRFAASRLRDLQRAVEDVVIQDLLARRDNQGASAILPGYLHRAGRFEELLQLLTPDNFERTLHHSQSLAPVKQQVDYGVKASIELHRDGELVRFSIHRSALLQLDNTDVWKAEIEARIALDDFETARALATSAGLKEDRLHLLSVIAKAKAKKGLEPESELLDSIKSLYGQVDKRHLGKRALDIATDLVYAMPTLALEMVEDSSRSGQDEETDAAIATLAMAAPKLDRLGSENDPGKEIRAKIRSPELKEFIEAASFKSKGSSASAVLASVDYISDVGKKIFFLRRWTVQNRQRSDAWEVVDRALAIAIKAAEYTPNARDMRELASPLPYIDSPEILQHLVGLFSANKGNIERYGPTIDYIRLLLLHMARGEYRHNITRGGVWFEEVYLNCTEIKDLAVRGECFAWLIVALERADKGRHLEASDKLHSLAEIELRQTIDELRKATAIHNTVFSGIVRALALVRIDFAVEIARSLNTETSRDSALAEAVESAIAVEDPPGGLTRARELIEIIVDPDDREKTLLRVLNRVKRRSRIPEAWGTEAVRFFELIQKTRDPGRKSRCWSALYSVLAATNAEVNARLIETAFQNLTAGLGQIDVGWEKVRAGFEAAALIAQFSSEHAKRLLSIAEEAKESALLQTEKAARAYIGTVLLAISAFAGLLRRRLTDENDLRRLGDLIDRIPSIGERARIWAEVALRAHSTKQAELCQRVVLERVRPLIHDLQRTLPLYAPSVVARVAPALHSAFPMSAKEELKLLPSDLRDAAYYAVCEYILSRHSDLEPYYTMTNQAFDIGYDQAVEICGIVDEIQHDGVAYIEMAKLVNSLVNGRQKSRVTRDQIDSIAAKLESFAASKFPNPKYITHNGYAICTRALVGKLKRGQSLNWDRLVDEARVLPNTSDRVFVLSCIANCCMSRDRSRAHKLLEQAYDIALTIPSVYDRVARIQLIAEHALELDASFAKRLVKSGMELTLDSGNEDLWPLQREMLDFVHAVDPNYAASLVSLADTDSARLQTRLSLQERLDVLNTAKSLADRPRQDDEPSKDIDHYPKAAWRLLGQLNANRVAHRKQEEMREYIEIASRLPVSDSYPILAWVIGNAVTRFGDTDKASAIVRPIFEATLVASQIAARMADQNSRVLRDALIGTRNTHGKSSNNLVLAGERDIAISRIRHWIEARVEGYLSICDPFFGPEDLELLTLVLESRPRTKVRILTSLKHQLQEGVERPFDETYINYWRTHISAQDPPDTEILIIGIQSTKDSPIHDRWWLTAGAGLRMGTSFRSLGIGKDAELSELSADSVTAYQENLDRYLFRKTKEHNGEKLSYMLFSLD